MSAQAPSPRIADALLKPLPLGVLGLGGLGSLGAMAGAGALGSALPALGLVALTALSYGALVVSELLQGPQLPPPPPRAPDAFDGLLAQVEAAAARCGPLLDEGGPALIEARLRVEALQEEARATVERGRRLRALLAELAPAAIAAEEADLRARAKKARDPKARDLLQAAAGARRAQAASREALLALDERGLAALTLAESALLELFARLSRLSHEGALPEAAGLLAEVDGLHEELATLQAATAATLAELGGMNVQGP